MTLRKFTEEVCRQTKDVPMQYVKGEPTYSPPVFIRIGDLLYDINDIQVLHNGTIIIRSCDKDISS
jgi:hypothetical protein